MKRGQAPTSLFLIIFSILIIVLILFFGFKAVTSMREKAEKSSLIKFRETFKNDLESQKKNVGSVSIKEYLLPEGVNEICFLDINNANPDQIINHEIMKLSLTNGEPENIFLTLKSRVETMQIEDLRLENDPYYSCYYPIGGKIKITIKSDGESIQVRMPPNQVYCNNAQEAELCNGLDIVFYTGYKSGCCKEFNLCC